MSEQKKYFTVILCLVFVLMLRQEFAYSQDNSPGSNKQNQEDILRVDANLVSVPTIVLDRDGKYITNLKKEDFQILEDGIEQELTFFEPTEKPFTVLLLLDRSGSMTNYLAELVRAANVFVNQLHPEDTITAVSFADDEDVLFQPTKVKDLQKGVKIKQHAGDRNTMIYDAIDFSFRKMKKISGRKAIVVFSDGSGGGLYASAKENLKEAEENDALIYTVQFDTFFKVVPSYLDKKTYFERVENAKKYMRDLAQTTGGRYYQIENISNLEETFRKIAEELGRQYTLGYYPKQLTAGKKQIKVKVKQPNVVVRARESYVVQPTENK